jgi:signal transduction histidine kinase
MDRGIEPEKRSARKGLAASDSEKGLERLESRYQTAAQAGVCVLAALALAFAGIAGCRKPCDPNAEAAYTISLITGFIIVLGVGYFLLIMRSMRREIGRKRVQVLPSRAERFELIRRVGELRSVLEASRQLEAARSLGDLCQRLAVEAEGLASGDAALVVLQTKSALTIAAATDPIDQDDAALAAQCQQWSSFLEDGGLPLLATGCSTIREAFGEGPLADRYGSAMEVPLLANGRLIGLVVVLRRVEAEGGFDADGLQAVGLLADVASHLILLRRVNSKMRRTNRRLVQSMDQLNRAQVQLVQTERVRAIGELVSGVAHELNNPLTSLLGFAQLLTLNESATSDSAKKWIDEIQREAARCSVILRNLLGFARRSAVGSSFGATAAIVSETLALKSYDLRSAKVEVRNGVPEALAAAALERRDLQQVLLNLINNAVDAMTASAQRVLTITGNADDDSVKIEISDTGGGIAPEHVASIFEPFFTTKPPGDAIGLGLTTCKKIVNDCGGSIAVRSKVGEGSTFTLVLPRARELVDATRPSWRSSP